MRRAVRTARGGVQSGVPPLLHLTDVVSCPNPALRSNKLLGELRVVRRKPVGQADRPKRVVPIVPVDERDRAVGHGAVKYKTARRVVFRPDARGLKPGFPREPVEEACDLGVGLSRFEGSRVHRRCRARTSALGVVSTPLLSPPNTVPVVGHLDARAGTSVETVRHTRSSSVTQS